MHTKHTKNLNENSALAKPSPERKKGEQGSPSGEGERSLSPEDFQHGQQLLGLLKQKVKYKQLDLLRELREVTTEQVFLEDITDSLKEEAADYRTLTQDWEFLLEDGGLIEVLRKLSPRQQEVVWLLVAGWTQKEIADQLGLTPAAVSQTKNQAYQQIRKLYRKG